MRWAWDSGNKNAQIAISVCSAVSCPESVPFRAFSFPQPSTISAIARPGWPLGKAEDQLTIRDDAGHIWSVVPSGRDSVLQSGC